MKVKHLLHCHLLLAVDRLRSAADAMPALQALLQGAAPATATPEDADTWLCRQFGVTPRQDSPTAALAALGDGLAAQAGYWLHADPVYVYLLRDRILLTEEPFADLTVAEAAALVGDLNRHFADDGLQFFAPCPNRWYLRLEAPADIATVARCRATGGDVQQSLPQGPEAMAWHRRLNEIQMLLHSHPVNAEREARDALPVNSVWLAGGGALPQGLVSPFDGVWADDALARGLAMACGQEPLASPASADAWLANIPQAGAHFVALDAKADLAQDWFVLLRQALNTGEIGRLSLHLASPHQVRSFSVTRADRWKIWRRSQIFV